MKSFKADLFYAVMDGFHRDQSGTSIRFWYKGWWGTPQWGNTPPPKQWRSLGDRFSARLFAPGRKNLTLQALKKTNFANEQKCSQRCQFIICMWATLPILGRFSIWRGEVLFFVFPLKILRGAFGGSSGWIFCWKLAGGLLGVLWDNVEYFGVL